MKFAVPPDVVESGMLGLDLSDLGEAIKKASSDIVKQILSGESINDLYELEIDGCELIYAVVEGDDPEIHFHASEPNVDGLSFTTVFEVSFSRIKQTSISGAYMEFFVNGGKFNIELSGSLVVWGINDLRAFPFEGPIEEDETGLFVGHSATIDVDLDKTRQALDETVAVGSLVYAKEDGMMITDEEILRDMEHHLVAYPVPIREYLKNILHLLPDDLLTQRFDIFE